MDEFSMIVLEDTLQFAMEVLPSELISNRVSSIRDYVNAVALNPLDYQSARNLYLALNQLSDIALENCRFMVEARLRSLARQFGVSDVARSA
jgi:hypothetical protein